MTKSIPLISLVNINKVTMRYRVSRVIVLALVSLLLLGVLGYAEAGVRVILSYDRITFYLVSGQSSPVDADIPIRVMVQSDVSWTLNYQATPLSGPKGKIMPERILVRTPYTYGFEGLHIPRLVGKGIATGATPVDVATMQFRFMPTGQERPGIYEGNIFSPEGGPRIHMRAVIKPEVEKVPSVPLEERGPVAPRIEMSLSPERIHFPVTGAPNEYDADSPVLLTVKSEHGFVVKAHATSLYSLYGHIPANRLFIKSGNRDYQSLEKEVVVLERPPEIDPKEKTVSTSLSFRLKTTWDDVAGEYRGQIIFTCAPEM